MAPSEQIGSAYAEVGFKVDESGLNSAKSKFSAAIGDMESKAKGVGTAIGGALKTGLEAGAVAAAGIATAGLVAYKDLESAASSAASKAVDVSGKSAEEIKSQYDTIQKHIMDVSSELGASTIFNPTQVAQTFDVLASKGVNVANVGKTELLPFLDLAAATQSDLASVTDLVTGSINSFGLQMSDSGQVADELAMAMNGSSASMETLNNALRQGGATAAASGMQLSEFNAIVGVLADKNYTGEQSGAALKTALLALYTPTKVQTETLEKLGLTYDQVDPRTHNFMDTLELLLSKGADVGDFGNIFTDSSGAIMYALAGEGDAVDALNNKIINSDGLAHTQAGLIMDTNKLVGAWETAKGAAEGLVTAIGGALEPAAVKLLNTWTAIAPAVQDFAVALASGNWADAGDMLADGIRSGWNSLRDLGGQLLDWLVSVDWASVGQYLHDGVQAGWNELMGIGSELLDALVSVDWASVGSALLDAVSSAIDSIIDVAGSIYDYFTGIDWAGAGTKLKDAFIAAVTSLANIGQQIWDYIGSIDWGTAGYKVADAIRNAITTLSNIGSTIWNYLTSADWSGAGSSITEKIRSGLQTLSKYWEEFKAGFLTVDWAGTASEVATKIKDAWKKISDWASGIIDGLKKDWQSWIDSNGPKTLGEDLAKAIAKGAYDLGKWIYDNIKSYFSTNGPSLRSAISSAIDFAKLALQTAYDFVTGFANTVLTAGKGTIGAAILEIIGNSMNSAWEGAGDGLITKAKEWRKDAENIFSSDDFDVDVSTTYTGAGNPKDLDGSTISVNVDYKSTTGAALTPYSTSGKTTVTSSEGEYYLKTKDFTQMKVTDWAKQLGQSGASYTDVLAMVNQMRTGKGDTTLSQKIVDQIMGAFTAGQDEYNKAHSGEAQVEASKEAAEITVNASEESAENTVDASETSADITVEAAKTVAGVGKSIAEALTTSTEEFLIGTQVAADAIKLGGGAVQVGITAAGKEIAVIGQTEQKRWTDMGETLYSKVIVSSDDWVGAVEKTTILVSNSWAEAANAAVEKSQTASSNYATAFEKAGVSWKADAAATSKATMAELAAGTSKLTFKVATSADEFKGGISTAKSTWQYGVSGSVGTWKSGVGNSGATLKSDASSAGTSMSGGGASAGSSMRSGGAAAASAMANAISYFGGSKWNYWGYAEGTVTSGPQMAVIGEDGPTNPEYVIPTKKKRWDLLYSVMRAYGLRGFAEGGSTEAGGAAGGKEAADPDTMKAYFSIQGLASMSKQVQKIITNLKDFFRLSWTIIKSEGITYWKEIEKVLIEEITTIRDGMWSALLDIRNTAISGNADILADAAATWSAYWPTVEPYMAEVSENATQDMADMKENIASQIDEMITGTESQMAAFEKKWKEIWTQLITDLNSAKAKITTVVNDIAALLKKISVTINASINVYESSGGGGGGGGGGGSDYLSDDEFSVGCGIKLSQLGGGTRYSYTLPKIFGGGTQYYYAARGALLDDGPKSIVAGEAGPELVLPASLTRMFLSLADAGLGAEAPSGSGKIVIEDHTVHEHYWDGRKVTNLVMTTTKKRLQTKGMQSVS